MNHSTPNFERHSEDTRQRVVSYGRAALVIAHPSHELRVHGWLELAQPKVFIWTDGSVARAHHAWIGPRKSWGEACESVSGPGSSVERTSAFRDDIAELVKEINARIVLDAGCGDYNWMRRLRLDLDLDHYIGIDVVAELISENQRSYANGRTSFHNIDFTRDKVSRADLILSRDCLVHLPFEDIFRALRNFKESGSTYLLTTTFTSHEKNTDIQAGDWRRLNLQLPPFNFPPPIKLIDEKREIARGKFANKYLALWALEDIRL